MVEFDAATAAVAAAIAAKAVAVVLFPEGIIPFPLLPPAATAAVTV